MGIDSVLLSSILPAIVGAIVGAIFGASGLLFFPLKRYMEKKLEKAENEASERNKYQRELYMVSGEERSATNKYLFWTKEAVVQVLKECACGKDRGDYFVSHLNEAAEELGAKETKRKEIERQQLADFNMENK